MERDDLVRGVLQADRTGLVQLAGLVHDLGSPQLLGALRAALGEKDRRSPWHARAPNAFVFEGMASFLTVPEALVGRSVCADWRRGLAAAGWPCAAFYGDPISFSSRRKPEATHGYRRVWRQLRAHAAPCRVLDFSGWPPPVRTCRMAERLASSPALAHLRVLRLGWSKRPLILYRSLAEACRGLEELAVLFMDSSSEGGPYESYRQRPTTAEEGSLLRSLTRLRCVRFAQFPGGMEWVDSSSSLTEVALLRRTERRPQDVAALARATRLSKLAVDAEASELIEPILRDGAWPLLECLRCEGLDEAAQARLRSCRPRLDARALVRGSGTDDMLRGWVR